MIGKNRRLRLFAVLGLAAMALGVWIHTRPSDSRPCRGGIWVEQSYAVFSPDMRHVAYVCHDYGGGADWIAVGNHWDESKPTEVVLAWTYRPDVDWRDDQHLVITLHDVSDIKAGLHEVIGVTVVYRIGGDISEQSVLREIDDYERSPSAVASIVARKRETYGRFKAWAVTNAENGSN